MCLSATVVILLFFLTKTIAAAEERGDSSNMYTRATVNFNEIFTNSLSMLADEPGLTSFTKDEDYRLNSIPTEFVEFRQQKHETTTVATPPPKYIRKSSHLKMDTDTDSEETSSVAASTYSSSPIINTSEAPEERSVKVLPIKRDYQRGVLDLLFPASRVRAFKSVFDTFRRILSHTFRRR